MIANMPTNGPVYEYYFKVSDCKAKTATQDDCVCWHKEGEGPFDTSFHDEPNPFLEWRVRSPKNLNKNKKAKA